MSKEGEASVVCHLGGGDDSLIDDDKLGRKVRGGGAVLRASAGDTP